MSAERIIPNKGLHPLERLTPRLSQAHLCYFTTLNDFLL
jgi:hypothetical protein